jgi:hypothetical protein
VLDVSAARAASVIIAAGPQRRIATVNVVNRFAMPCPKCLPARADHVPERESL